MNGDSVQYVSAFQNLPDVIAERPKPVSENSEPIRSEKPKLGDSVSVMAS